MISRVDLERELHISSTESSPMMSPELLNRFSNESIAQNKQQTIPTLMLSVYAEIPSPGINLPLVYISRSTKEFIVAGMLSVDDIAQVIECEGFTKAVISQGENVLLEMNFVESEQVRQISMTEQGLMLYISSIETDI